MTTAPSVDTADAYVFVSYSHRDKPLVDDLVAVIADRGLTVRRDDDLRAGEAWASRLAELRAEAGAVVVVWSRAAMQSDAVLEEAAGAQATGTLVPVTLDGLDSVPPSFRRLFTVDLSGWTGDEGDRRLEPLVAALAERVTGVVGATPPEPGVSADVSAALRVPPRRGAIELLGFALEIAGARRAAVLTDGDIVLASLVRRDRTVLNRAELEGAASTALNRAVPEPVSSRIEAALSAVGVDHPLSAPDLDVAPGDPRVARVLSDGSELAHRLGVNAVWSHHLVALALAGEPLPEAVVAALGVSQAQLCDVLRSAIATRWRDEPSDVWDDVLGPVTAAAGPPAELAEETVDLMGWAQAVQQARGADAVDDVDVVLGALAAARSGAAPPSAAGLLRSVPDLDVPRAERLDAAFVALGMPSPVTDPASTDPARIGRVPALDRAATVARLTGATAVWAHHLLAGALGGRPLPPHVHTALGVDHEALRRCLREHVADVWPAEPADAWDAELGPLAEVELAYSHARDLVSVRRRPRPGQQPEPPLEDHLGVEVYVGMLATLIARDSTSMPLSIGLFGEWGSGKSYFMELLREQVDTLAATAKEAGDAGKSPYLGDILQIRFNAWHYADTNLWASLAAEFFDQLARPDTDPIAERREELTARLAEAHRGQTELEKSKKEAEERTADLRVEWAQAVAERARKTRTFNLDLLRAVAADPQVSADLGRVARHLGLGGAEQEATALRIAQDVSGIADDVTATRRVLARRSLWFPFTLLVLTTAVAGLALVAPENWAGWFRGGSVAAVTTLVGSIAVVIGRARLLVHRLRSLSDRAQAVEIRVRGSAGLAALATQMYAAEVAEAAAQARVDDAQARIAELDHRLDELRPGRRLYDFLTERAASTDYRSRLGVVSLVRRDFEQLVTLMKEWKEAGDTTEARKPIDRIVLYIDDLDRCEPDQVVTVLQAVHLLLALELFVVVVGVDPRWLLRSLRRRYRRVLGAGAVAAGDRESGFSESTPQNYLEKIFQIPFVLPGIDEIGFTRLVSHLATPGSAALANAVASTTSSVDATPDLPDPPARPATPTEAQPAEAQSEVAAVVRSERHVTVTQITKDELALLSSLAPLIGTPRAATRLFNIYGLLRSTRNLTEGSRFLGTRDRPGDYQAVLQLLGVLTSAPQLLGVLLWGRSVGGSEPRGLLNADPAGSWASFVDGLNPTGEGPTWHNSVAEALSADEVQSWRSLFRHLRGIRNQVKADDIERYQLWGPRVARFSFLLSPFATEPEIRTTEPNS